MRIVNKIEAKTPQIPRRKRVAAYARVSMESERLQHSLSAQVSFYSSLIQSNPAWEYVGVYADNGITGTKAEAREEFNRMIADCEAGKIDIVLTKSISRFARNTVDLLNTVRRLKELGVSVQFEKERIDSLTEDGELMLTLLASFAQEEIRSLSDNVKWGTRKRFEKGIPNGRFQIYGYRWEGDHLVIHEEEAKIVRLIYDNYMNGLSAETTEKQLAEMGVKSYKGQHFGNTSIRQILGNITYTGNLLFQKEYVADPISKKSRINRGELPQYFVENTHEAIIPMEVYQAVQAEKARRRELGALANWSINTSCFSSKIKCGRCGKSYQRSNRKGRKDPNANYTIWVCGTRRKTGNAHCQNKDIPEQMLNLHPLKAVGVNYILFAQEEPNLFKLLFMTDREKDISIFKSTLDDNKIEYLSMIKEIYDFNDEQANQYYVSMWIFSHGIATMLVSDLTAFTTEEISKLLTFTATSVIAKLKKGETL